MKRKHSEKSAPAVGLDDAEIEHELDQFRKERGKIKRVLDSIEESRRGPLHRMMDVGFVVLLVFLALARFAFGWIDNILSLEFGLLLLSVKIMWLINIQNNYNHFIFMIMHTIDHHQNQMLDKLDAIGEEVGVRRR